MATRAEHYATMMKDVRDEINEDRIKCFTDPEDGTHFTQFADGSVIDDGGSAFSSKTWEEIVLPNFGVTLCADSPKPRKPRVTRQQKIAAMLASLSAN